MTLEINDVVVLEQPEPSIMIINMVDKKNRNMISPEIMQGLELAFKYVSENNELKVVIVSGYDQYFSCGGTKNLLLEEFTTGKISFDTLEFFKMPMECEIPTIAAVQGHAIGGGLAFACMFDYMILSRESVFSANFMKYGFTPGMLSTFNLPRRFGLELGNEMLMSAAKYFGKDLEDRHIPLPIVNRVEVMDRAMGLANQFIDKPRNSLRLLKSHLVKPIKKAWPEIIEAELSMHKQTMTTAETKRRIQELFDDD